VITCKLNDKTYTVDFVSGRALREIGPATEMYGKVNKIARDAAAGIEANDDGITIEKALDVMVKWFCLVFQNQFTPDDVYDGYPADRVMHDIALTLMSVQTQTTEVLHEFPFPTNPEANTQRR